MRFKTLLKLIAIPYIVFSFYVLFNLLTGRGSYTWSAMKTQDSGKQVQMLRHNFPQNQRNSKRRKVTKSGLLTGDKITQNSVEIWGKAAIGLYLWQHIFEAPLENIQGDFLKYGKIEIKNIVFQFRTGPMVIPQSVNNDAKNIVLIINGREPKKVKFALTWLETVKKIENLRNFAIVLLGNEQCKNEWLMPYMKINGGFIKFAFIVYDVPYIDDKYFHPWPLGVATYRNFPAIHSSHLKLQHKRKYICNFLGTVYENSSRIELMNIINSNEEIKRSCLVHSRENWLPSETKDSSELYQNSMRDSDITLCPVGKNTECYRIYEAISYGSLPIVEDVLTPGECGQASSNEASTVPLRILKRMNAPILYIKSWSELPNIIASEKRMPLRHIIKRRTQLVHWYEKFKFDLREYFVKQLKNGFNFE